MEYYKEPIKLLVNIGLLDVILPFAISFSLIYSLLQYTKILGSEKGGPKKKENIIVSFALSFVFVAFINYVSFVERFFSFFVIAIFVVIVFFLIHNILSGSAFLNKNLARMLVASIFAVVLLLSLNLKDVFPADVISKILPVLIFFGALFFVLWFILRDSNKRASESEKSNEKSSDKDSECSWQKIGRKNLEDGKIEEIPN